MANYHLQATDQLDPIAKFQHEFCIASAIDPELYAIAVQVRDEQETSAGHDASWPIHDALGWEPPSTQYQTSKPHRFMAGAFLLQETGEAWQVKPQNPRPDKSKPGKVVKYETPRSEKDKNGDKKSSNSPFLPPITKSCFAKICKRNGLDVEAEWAEKQRLGGFWNWIAERTQIPLIPTEGGKKGLAAISQGTVAIAFQGIWNAIIKTDNGVALLPSIDRFFTKDRPVVVAFDQDENPWKTALAQRRLVGVLLRKGCTVKVAKWDRRGGACKGIDDLIATAGPDAWEKALADAEQQTIEPLPIPSWARVTDRTIGRGAHNQQADWIADRLKNAIAWDIKGKCWIAYNRDPKFPGLWQPIEPEYVHRVIKNAIEEMEELLPVITESREKKPKIDGYTMREVSALTDLTRLQLLDEPRELDRDLLPFKNGILNTRTGFFAEGHKPENRLRWQLPYDYDPMATCDPIVSWLHEATNNDPAIVEVLRAFLRAVLLGRADLQRFLELVGPGGTGKSTLTRLMVALVGESNTKSTSLKELENGRFEGAELVGKRLILISDSDRYGGSVSVLKCITGGDPIRVERKYQQETQSALIEAMVVLTVNEAIQTSDYTSGLQRRRLVIPFTNQIDPANQRDLITVGYGKTSGEFAPFLPGLVNWVLGVSEERMQALVRNTAREVPSLESYRVEALLDANPMAQWVDQCLLFEPLARERVGMSNDAPSASLYASYCEFVKNSGAHPVSANRFSTLFQDLISKQLKQPIEKGRNRFGMFFEGVRIRTESDTDPRPLTGPLDGNIPVLPTEPIEHQTAPIEQQPITQTETPVQPFPVGTWVAYSYLNQGFNRTGEGRIERYLENGFAVLTETKDPVSPIATCYLSILQEDF